MSLRYRDKNGVETVVSGLTPGGNIEYGAVATRKGTLNIGAIAAGADGSIAVTFSEPMPDADYLIDFNPNTNRLNITESNTKTKNGFTCYYFNNTSAATSVSTAIVWTAYKLYDIADAEQLYSQLQDISAMVPSNASSSNQFSTKSDLQAVNRSLDMRLDDVEDVVPTTATIANKLATAADVAEAMANAGLKVTDTIPANPSDGDVLLYIGTETGFEKGGIYQYVANPGAWVLISTAEVDLSDYSTSFVGTTAQWNALSSTDKNKYVLVNLTDDQEALGVDAVDAVTDGDMRPVTSNAVYDAIQFGGKRITPNKITLPSNGDFATIANYSDFTGNYLGFLFEYGSARVPFDIPKIMFNTSSSVTTRLYLYINSAVHGTIWLNYSNGAIQACFKNDSTQTSTCYLWAYTHN